MNSEKKEYESFFGALEQKFLEENNYLANIYEDNSPCKSN